MTEVLNLVVLLLLTGGDFYFFTISNLPCAFCAMRTGDTLRETEANKAYKWSLLPYSTSPYFCTVWRLNTRRPLPL
jgi:hypothetical protein